MAGNTVLITVAGDSTSLERAFERVGASAKDMAGDVDKAGGKMKATSKDIGDGLRDSFDTGEQRIVGFRDALTGTGDLMEGFKTGRVDLIATGFADLASSMSNFVIPALQRVGTTIMTQLGPALSFVGKHPVFVAIAVGGAIIAGLILLEKKFGVVSGAVDWLKARLGDLGRILGGVGQAIGGAFSAGVAVAKNAINGLIGLVEKGLNFVMTPYRAASGFLNKIPGVGSAVPDFLTKDIKLPRLHTGGIVPGPVGQEVPIMALAGERVLPIGQSGAGITVVVNGAVDPASTARQIDSILRDARRRGLIPAT